MQRPSSGVGYWNPLSLSSRTCFGILVLILSKDGSMILDGRRRTVFYSVQRFLERDAETSSDTKSRVSSVGSRVS